MCDRWMEGRALAAPRRCRPFDASQINEHITSNMMLFGVCVKRRSGGGCIRSQCVHYVCVLVGIGIDVDVRWGVGVSVLARRDGEVVLGHRCVCVDGWLEEVHRLYPPIQYLLCGLCGVVALVVWCRLQCGSYGCLVVFEACVVGLVLRLLCLLVVLSCVSFVVLYVIACAGGRYRKPV